LNRCHNRGGIAHFDPDAIFLEPVNWVSLLIEGRGASIAGAPAGGLDNIDNRASGSYKGRMGIRKKSWSTRLWCGAALALLLLLASEAAAQDSTTTESTEVPKQEDTSTRPSEERATQRLDFGVDFYSSDTGNIRRGGLNYTWSPLADHSFAATLPVISSRLGNVEGSGIGDLVLRYNWVPAETLSAEPWVPNSLGIGVGLLIPSGDASQGTGGDQWVIGPTLGFVARLGRRTTLLPQLQYLKSFAEGELAQGVDSLSLSADLIHVFQSEFWIQYTPGVSYDREAEQYELDNLFVLGQKFTRRIALRFELRTLNVADPQDPAGDGRELDYRATLKLQWILAY